MLLWRTAYVVVTAVPVAVAAGAVVLHHPWAAVSWLLPALACTLCVAAASTWHDPVRPAAVVAVGWTGVVVAWQVRDTPWAITTASTQLVALAVSAWQLRNNGDREMFGSAAKIALPMVCVAIVGSFLVGDRLMSNLVERQPMKVAAAEAMFDTEGPAAFSLLATGDFTRNPGHTNRDLKVPHVLSLLATHTWDGQVEGINQLNKQYQAKYGPGEYAPFVAVVYWSFRIMVYTWGALLLFAAIGLLLWRKGKLEVSRRWLWWAMVAGIAPFIINTAGWVMTEMGRQPWIVQGLLKTSDAVSPRVTTGQVVLTLVGFVALFTVIGGIALWLFLREAKSDTRPPSPGDPSDTDAQEPTELSLAY